MTDRFVTTPATARTDTARTDTARTDTARTGPDAPAGSAGRGRAAAGDGAAPVRAVRAAGVVLAVGAVAAGTSFLVAGPDAGEPAARVHDLVGLVFQLGLVGLVTAMLRTRATGTSRAATWLLKVEYGLLVPASAWSLLHAVLPAPLQESSWMAVLDVFWPLSMLGMVVIAVRVAVAGRWRGPLRFYPLVAESWGVVSIPAVVVLGPATGGAVAGLHMILGYGVLGLLLALRPGLTSAR
jgi:hypothetical protein